MIVGVTCEIFAFSFGSALPEFAHVVLMTGAQGLGTLSAATSIGGTLALILLTMVPIRVRREALLGPIFVAFGVSIVGVALTRDLVVATAVLVLTGACAGAFDLLQQTLIQLAVPAGQRGRAVGVWIFGLGSAPLGNLEMGMLMATLGVPGALLINGIVVIVSATTLLVRVPRYRWGLLVKATSK